MFWVLCRKMHFKVKLIDNTSQNQLGFHQILKSPTKSFSSSSPSKTKTTLLLDTTEGECQEHSFTVTYLMNSCGLSYENAVKASLKVHFETPDRPDTVLRLLRNHEFNHAQVAQFVRIRPKFLLSNVEKTLLPKLEFFRSIGFSETALSGIISSHPSLLSYSLVYHLIPIYNFMKGFLQDDKKIVIALMNYPKILQYNLETIIVPNISVLRGHGVPAASISFLLSRHGHIFVNKCDNFEKCVKEVIEMGFNPSKLLFVVALNIILGMTESAWNQKREVYRKWGWSEMEFQGAFRLRPTLMYMSETKLNSVMEFLVNQMGFESSVIAKYPYILAYSLQKRIIPRCSVIKILLSKGLVKNSCVSTFLIVYEKVFLDKFVTKYEGDVPELLSIYKENRRINEVK